MSATSSNPAGSISISVANPDGLELESIVDQDIHDFDQYFQNVLKNGALSKPERAILKTYIWYKTRA